MNILVCVKQVPGTTQVDIDPATGVLKRDGVDSKLNPYDLFALEAALKLSESTGGSVTTLTMGPGQAKDALMETIYMGADKAVLVSDRKFAGADVLATAYTLFQAVKAAGSFDLILCGKQTTDGDTAQVGSELAEFLGIPHAAGVLSILPSGTDRITVKLNREETIVTKELPLPCLLCADGDINTPRLPSYKIKKSIGADPVTTLTLNDFNDKNQNRYGLSGSPTQVERIFPPDKNMEKEIYNDRPEKLAETFFDLLNANKFL